MSNIYFKRSTATLQATLLMCPIINVRKFPEVVLSGTLDTTAFLVYDPLLEYCGSVLEYSGTK